MLSFSIILLFITINGQPTDKCLWGVDDTSTTGGEPRKNGLYRYAGCLVSTNPCPVTKQYYRLIRSDAGCTDGGDDSFLCRSGTKWIITGTSPCYGNQYYGTCSANADNILDCATNGNWQIPAGVDQTNAVIIDDKCPVKVCGSITVTSNVNAGACDTDTFTQIGDNMFEKDGGGNKWVWWFNSLSFQWVCTKLNSDGTPSNNGASTPATPIGTCTLGVALSQTTGAGFGDNGRKMEEVNGFDGPFNGDHADSVNSGQTWTFACVTSGGSTTTKPPTTPLPTVDSGGSVPSPTYITNAPTMAPHGPNDGTTPAPNPAGEPATTPIDGQPTAAPDGSDGSNRIRNNWIALFTVLALCASILIV